uniref:Uncharacterized protein n=1 Tax=Zea mays TaxID=4577 RepID=C4J1L2_MAIZE|nr:unknown [Zea mays]ACR36981.1 unknown [Zea mays]
MINMTNMAKFFIINVAVFTSRLLNKTSKLLEIKLQPRLYHMVHSHLISAVLDEANVLGIAAEALPAAHQPVLPDQSMRVRTDTADAGSGPVVLGVRVPDVGVPHRLLIPPPPQAFVGKR